MKEIKLLDMWKKTKEDNVPLLFDSNIVDTFPFLREYIENFTEFDRQIVTVMSEWRPMWNLDKLDSLDEVISQFHTDCRSVVRRYNYNLDKVFKLIEIEYNPLENYNRHEESQDDSSGSATDINNYGARKDTENLGQVKLTSENGEVAVTESVGPTSSTTKYGKVGRVETNKVAGFNSADFVNSNKSEINEDAREDVVSTIAATNSSSTGAHTDVETKSAVENSHSEDEHEDVLSNEHKETAKRISEIKGNIGVMSTQNMYEQEWAIIKDKNPYDILLYFIKKDLLILLDDGLAPLLTPLQNEAFMI